MPLGYYDIGNTLVPYTGEDDDDGDFESDLMGALDLVGANPGAVATMLRAAKAGQKRGRNAAATKAAQNAYVQAAVAQKAVDNATQVSIHEPNRAREYPLGFDSVATVAAGATVDVTSQPQVVFRPDRFVVPDSIAPSFLILDLRIGKNSQFVSAQAVPAETFSNNAFGVRLKMDTAQIAQSITLRVTNISLAATRFFASMIGPALE